MSDTAELLVPLFRHAWGATLGELAAADRLPFALPDTATPIAEPARRAAAQARASVTEELVSFLWSQNQFATIDRAARSELSRSVGKALATIARGADLTITLIEHRAELAAWVRARYGETPREVVCAEYSPSLQLAVLGLEPTELVGPVLDVGCGPSAALVRSLRAVGLSAHGLDRSAPVDVASRGDWLTFDYGTARWGTVLSHLGFTLHFLHHHLADGTTAYEYARAYMAMLRSLRVGGVLVYTPGVAFLEELLDADVYRVVQRPFAKPLRVDALVDIEAATGLSLSHATHVERLR